MIIDTSPLPFAPVTARGLNELYDSLTGAAASGLAYAAKYHEIGSERWHFHVADATADAMTAQAMNFAACARIDYTLALR